MQPNVAQTLSTAINLESLCIIVDGTSFGPLVEYRPGGPTAFQEILDDCKFPRLRSLILSGFDSTEAELIEFLGGSSDLQHLTLTHHALGAKEKWESCANKIKATLPSLENITVNALESGYRGPLVCVHTHTCSCTDVQEFFLQGEANPFSCAHKQDEGIRVAFITNVDDAYIAPGGRACNTLWKASYLKFH